MFDMAVFFVKPKTGESGHVIFHVLDSCESWLTLKTIQGNNISNSFPELNPLVQGDGIF
jgi:hypothetical protein